MTFKLAVALISICVGTLASVSGALTAPPYGYCKGGSWCPGGNFPCEIASGTDSKKWCQRGSTSNSGGGQAVCNTGNKAADAKCRQQHEVTKGRQRRTN